MMIIFTASIGPMSAPPHLRWPLPDTEYVCFCEPDKPIPEPWIKREPTYKNTDPARIARWCKILAHRHFNAEISIWCDAAVEPIFRSSSLILDWLAKADLAAFRHRLRTCIYEELETIRTEHLDDPLILNKHESMLRNADYPAKAGLHETGILCRRHSKEVAAFNEVWWWGVEAGSRRDQLSFDYALRRCNLTCADLAPGTAAFNPWFVLNESPNRPGRRLPSVDGQKAAGASVGRPIELEL